MMMTKVPIPMRELPVFEEFCWSSAWAALPPTCALDALFDVGAHHPGRVSLLGRAGVLAVHLDQGQVVLAVLGDHPGDDRLDLGDVLLPQLGDDPADLRPVGRGQRLAVDALEKDLGSRCEGRRECLLLKVHRLDGLIAAGDEAALVAVRHDRRCGDEDRDGRDDPRHNRPDRVTHDGASYPVEHTGTPPGQ
jgi:hypothetical protein